MPRLDAKALNAAHARCLELCGCRDVIGYGGRSLVDGIAAAYTAALTVPAPTTAPAVSAVVALRWRTPRKSGGFGPWFYEEDTPRTREAIEDWIGVEIQALAAVEYITTRHGEEQ